MEALTVSLDRFKVLDAYQADSARVTAGMHRTQGAFDVLDSCEVAQSISERDDRIEVTAKVRGELGEPDVQHRKTHSVLARGRFRLVQHRLTRIGCGDVEPSLT